MYSRWRLVAFNLEGVLARACALPELVHVPAEAVASLDSLSKEVKCLISTLAERMMYDGARCHVVEGQVWPRSASLFKKVTAVGSCFVSSQ